MTLWDDEKTLGFHLRMALFLVVKDGAYKKVEIPEKDIVANIKEALRLSNGDENQAFRLLEEKLIELARRS